MEIVRPNPSKRRRCWGGLILYKINQKRKGNARLWNLTRILGEVDDGRLRSLRAINDQPGVLVFDLRGELNREAQSGRYSQRLGRRDKVGGRKDWRKVC